MHFVLKLKSFTSTVTVFQAGRWDKVKKDKMEFSAKKLRKYYKNMSCNSVGWQLQFNLTPSLGTSICCGCCLKKKQKKQKKPHKEVMLYIQWNTTQP